MNIKQLLWWWGPVLALCALIFWLSATPNLQVSQGPSDYFLRKTAHMAVYGSLFLLVYRALIKSSYTNWNIIVVIWASLLTLGYAASDELHQHFVPTRSGLWTDLVFDAAGVSIAIMGLAWWGWWKRILFEAESEPARRQDG